MSDSTISQGMMSGALLHFERGVPIDDLKLQPDQRQRLARVQHVYWQWVRNPFLDAKELFRQMAKTHNPEPSSVTRTSQKDFALFEFVRDHVAGPSRKDSEAKVRVAAEKAIRIGMETDNVMALTKGGKLLYDVAGLDKPESEQVDMAKVAFLPPVVTTNIRDVDDTKEEVSDEETKKILSKYKAYVDDKSRAIEEKVAVMEAKSASAQAESNL